MSNTCAPINCGVSTLIVFLCFSFTYKLSNILSNVFVYTEATDFLKDCSLLINDIAFLFNGFWHVFPYMALLPSLK